MARTRHKSAAPRRTILDATVDRPKADTPADVVQYPAPQPSNWTLRSYPYPADEDEGND